MMFLIGFDIMLSYVFAPDDIEGIESVFKWIDKLRLKKCTDVGSLMLLTHFIPITYNIIQKFKINKLNFIKHATNPLHW